MAPSITVRTVLVNRHLHRQLPDSLADTRFPDNTITTTKYSLITFLPKNLFEQFRRLCNFYFLCLAGIHLSIESPVSPMTSLLPLVVVITVTAVKQAYEDWLRHCEDTKVNNAPSRVLRDGVITEVRRSKVIVGDIVEVRENEEFPCDLLLLTSRDPGAKCEVTTANLDGETNLKAPHANLYDFKGCLEVYRGNAEPARASLGSENLLLRGTKLKNTTTVYGVAVYTGKETKMALNSKLKSTKFSSVEKSMNYLLLFFLALLVLEILGCMLLKYQLYGQDVTNKMWYLDLPTNETITAADVYQDGVSFLVIFSYIIPISLYVTLEMQKFLSTLFLKWDQDLVGGEKNEAAHVNTSDLNEELGQVKYLFTDKTGTLTENIMHFRQCSVQGVKYADVAGILQILDESGTTNRPLPELPEALVSFLETLALCHSVQLTLPSPARSEGKEKGSPKELELQDMSPEYQASSPDEKALVDACARFGVVLRGQWEDRITLDVLGRRKLFTRLQVLDFDSDRKCMSVVVRDEASERIWLLTKGAESSVLRRCRVRTADERAVHDATLTHINHYAMLGLRTLAVARRELHRRQYQSFARQLLYARQMLEGREEAVKQVVNRMEAKLSLLGATGVEDLLQEGVQETLEALRVAGIKVWMLTGDKVETAVNIAYSCGHFKRFMTILSLTGLQDPEHAASTLQQCQEGSSAEGAYGLVVDGVSLELLLTHLRKDFYRLCRRCWAVVCCRMTPGQKAETVRLVKTSKESPVCAAIGDGANDVSMIQEAHVGLGIMGKEGRRAVRCSDFGIARFRFLQKLFFVHGHWNYVREAVFVQHSFYKNITFNTPMLFYCIWNAFSTQSVYESLVLTLYNITFTTLPVLVYGISEQNLPPDLLMSRPHLYQRNSNNALMSWRVFFKWNLFGLWHAVVMYTGLVLVCYDSTCGLPQGQTSDLYLFGMSLGTLCVFVTNFKIAVQANYLSVLFVGSLVLTILGYSAQYLLYCGLPVEPFSRLGMYWVYYRMFQSPALLLACVLLGVVCLLPDLLEKVCDHSTDRERRLRRKGVQCNGKESLRTRVGVINEALDLG
ncbi:phospholipid-transporting ATPase IF-like isoform X2 [Panulirus ornatus]|uniref:phospholipid-transporting ATPase IF-like isoform X2 n=1 Tax=Panulirus ornatus TaxID=150431 RepID=UPI003A8C4855